VLFFTTSIRYGVNELRLYEYGFRRYDVPAVTGLSLEQLNDAARRIQDYFNSDEETLYIQVEQDGRETALFSPKERAHMRDVKSLIRMVYWVQNVTLAYGLSYVVLAYVWAREAPIRFLARGALWGGGLTLAVMALLGMSSMINFGDFWIQFHELAFTNDLWQLNPRTDRLIQMFPEPFWRDATLFVGLLTMAQALAVIAVSAVYLRLRRSKVQRGLPELVLN
jgi:integral membrane protein (TIGR01906 family)